MRRVPALVLLLFLGQCLSGSTPGPVTSVHPQRIMIASSPVALDSSDPRRRRLGALTFMGGWSLSSDTRSFGGLSALDVDGRRITALSDIGAVMRFRLGRFGNASDAGVIPIPRGCAPALRKEDNDSESLTHDPARSAWWIGIEFRNVICRTTGDFARGKGFAPASMAGWSRKRGPETLMRLADGRFLTLAEKAPDSGILRPGLLFDRDPTDSGAKVTRFSYKPPEGYSPVDAAQLPDGTILVLNRRFALQSLFTAVLVVVDTDDLGPGQIVEGREVARLEPPIITDNFEGVSVSQEDGRTIVWIVSDDNYMRWQRTLLLKFAIG